MVVLYNRYKKLRENASADLGRLMFYEISCEESVVTSANIGPQNPFGFNSPRSQNGGHFKYPHSIIIFFPFGIHEKCPLFAHSFFILPMVSL